MMHVDLNQSIYVLILSLVAGTPLTLSFICCTPMRQIAWKALPLAALPALIAVVVVPSHMVFEVPWFFMSGRMGLDDTGRIFLGVTSFIWLLASLSSCDELVDDPARGRFNGFFLAAMAGNFGLILARGMLGYYLFFALMSFTAFGLVVHKGTKEARKAGRIYLVFVMLGEVALFLAMVILADSTNGLLIENIGAAALQPITLILLFTGFGIKIGALPFYAWMPFAYRATPIPAATALAGAMVNSGLLGWLRFIPLGEASSTSGAFLFIISGALATLYGVILGLIEKRAEAILAYSSISQMGLITVIFGLGLTGFDAGRDAVFILTLYAVHHSLAKSSLFLGYGVLQNRNGSVSRWQIACLLLPAFSLAGLPFTSGAVSKMAFKELAFSAGEHWIALSSLFLPVSAVGTTTLVLHFIRCACRSEGSSKINSTSGLTIWAASLVSVTLAIYLWPAALVYVVHSIEPDRFWDSLWPILTGCFLFLTWRCFARSRRGGPRGSGRNIFTLLDQRFGFEWRKNINQVARWIQNKRIIYKIKLFNLSSYTKIELLLRKTEKIIGRWTVVGFSYVLLCIMLLFLLK